MGSELRRSILNDVTAIASSVPPAWRLPICLKNWVKNGRVPIPYSLFSLYSAEVPSQQSRQRSQQQLSCEALKTGGNFVVEVLTRCVA